MDRTSREANWTSAQQHLWLELVNASSGYPTTGSFGSSSSSGSPVPVVEELEGAVGRPELAASVQAYRDFTTAAQVLILVGSLLGLERLDRFFRGVFDGRFDGEQEGEVGME
ncbi:hypothetical protein WMY93_015799 [Mugilogobius chulae]|uniref:Uncharacterized protein n=1 Tax=Mugilogobius chulae TaxID=88201 RepID=A0AAW0NS89_9GOBI